MKAMLTTHVTAAFHCPMDAEFLNMREGFRGWEVIHVGQQ